MLLEQALYNLHLGRAKMETLAKICIGVAVIFILVGVLYLVFDFNFSIF